ncbi:MAG: hypothetical protein HJJLKODD_01772 [Phycisphaerae bacterium]|nr:hypothetical protein [Phycisphaerae bacterium]
MSTYTRYAGTRTWVNFSTFLASLSGLALIIIGLFQLGREGAEPLYIGLLMVSGVGLVGLGWLMAAVAGMLLKLEANTYRMHEAMLEQRAAAEQHSRLLEIIKDNSQISDAAKSITHRSLEREALRKAIREDIIKEDWESAYNLIEEMERRFGYRLEAYHYRKEVDEFRAKVIEEKLQSSINNVRRWIREKNWEQAVAETERLLQLAPKDGRVVELVNEIQAQKNEYKNTLLQQWHEAVEKHDLDVAITLLREIDPYLTREESQKLEKNAREVFKAKLLDLGVQFRNAVTERRWKDALTIGQMIRDEFPNSLMAKEVGESMEALRTKAATP